MRLVYEIESRVHDLKRAATPASNTAQQQQQQEAPATNPKNPPKSELRRDREPQTPNYSRDHGQPDAGRVTGGEFQQRTLRPGGRVPIRSIRWEL